MPPWPPHLPRFLSKDAPEPEGPYDALIVHAVLVFTFALLVFIAIRDPRPLMPSTHMMREAGRELRGWRYKLQKKPPALCEIRLQETWGGVWRLCDLSTSGVRRGILTWGSGKGA